VKVLKSEGGHGVRGHSNMDHWTVTAILKWYSKKRRRFNDKAAVKEQSE
jgi:hypothetical protein